MFNKTLFSLVESPTHPLLTELYEQQGINERRFKSMRKLMSTIKKVKPDFIVAEFFYGFGNNYAGINISNLDVMLYSLQRYSPDTKLIIFVDKEQRQYVDQLNKIFPLHDILIQPVDTDEVLESLSRD